jgi:hypothetical protein
MGRRMLSDGKGKELARDLNLFMAGDPHHETEQIACLNRRDEVFVVW